MTALEQKQHRLGLILVACAALAWSSGGIFTRIIPTDLMAMLFWRGLFSGSAVMLFFFAAEGSGGGGFLVSVFGWTPGYGRTGVILALTYLWLPYMVLPIYAGLERLPASLLDAAGDLGARPMRTFRTVIMPLLLPSPPERSVPRSARMPSISRP